MEFRRIFYRDGSHDEIPFDVIRADANVLVFMSGATEMLRVPSEDIVAIEDR
jgi:hypothetical protein